MPVTTPYGAWRSPITAAHIAGHETGLSSPWLDGRTAYWCESRAAEGGRTTLLRRLLDGRPEEMTPAPFNLRTRVHEYGGRCFTAQGGIVTGVDFADQRLYRLTPGAPKVPLTPACEGALRFADLALDPKNGRVLAVREDHRGGGTPRNEIVAVPLEGDRQPGEVLATGHDFVAYPRPSPDGARLAWIAWNHPDMPWDATELWVQGPGGRVRIDAAGPRQSLIQPEWAPDGTLYVLTDRSGYWNLARVDGPGKIEPVAPMAAEIGGPLWQLGARWLALLDASTALAVAFAHGRGRLLRIDLPSGAVQALDVPFAEMAGVCAAEGRLLLHGMAADAPAVIAMVDPSGGAVEIVAQATAEPVAAAYVARPEPIAFTSAGGRTAHGLFYAPTNPDHRPSDGERPPLVVRSHGGPTGRASPALNLQIQFWTTRGFAVVDVDYGGSTGYGRDYRQRLDGMWGVVDVEDCVAAARHLAATGRVDPERIAIRGGSAGGYTTLAALTFTDAFKAGASAYGVVDLEALARDTHKFESRYLDRLVGPWPAAAALYRARSPIHHVDRLRCPVIFLQGLDDKVVPPNQAEAMAAALRAKGLPVAHLAFEGEGHGFRRAETIERALQAELAFFCRIFGITPAERLPPLEIDNLS